MAAAPNANAAACALCVASELTEISDADTAESSELALAFKLVISALALPNAAAAEDWTEAIASEALASAAAALACATEILAAAAVLKEIIWADALDARLE